MKAATIIFSPNGGISLIESFFLYVCLLIQIWLHMNLFTVAHICLMKICCMISFGGLLSEKLPCSFAFLVLWCILALIHHILAVQKCKDWKLLKQTISKIISGILFSDLSRKVGVHLTIIEGVKVGGAQIVDKCPINRSVIVSTDVVKKPISAALLRDFGTVPKPNVFLGCKIDFFAYEFFSINMFLC